MTTNDPPAFDLRAVLPNSLLEWDGRVAAVAVAGGCNWRCPYCHGRKFIRELDRLPKLPLSALWSVLDRQDGWLDGVVVSGGEPTMQPGLPDLLREIAARGLPVKLHTNGSRPDVLEALAEGGLVHTLALDAKAPLDARLARAAGVALSGEALEAVRRSFALARAAPGLTAEYHTTLCPAVFDPAWIGEMAAEMAPSAAWFLQPFRPGDVLDPAGAGEETFSSDALAAMLSSARGAHPAGRVVLT